ncbi:MAG: hypothetical protein AMJ43_04855 [Coxiella sp. DG_40]|nr:MAG: hypothetical protein AMJ43_04855 [Coxiella sp. DG_40]
MNRGRTTHVRDRTENLVSDKVRQLIECKRITRRQASTLNWWQIKALENQDIFDKVNTGTLDIRLAHVPELQDHVDKGLITLEQAINLDSWRARNLDSKEVKGLIDENRITLEQALKFLYWEKDGRVHENKDYIKQGLITLEQVLNLEAWQVHFLNFPWVRILIQQTDNHVMDQILALSKVDADSLVENPLKVVANKRILGYIKQGLITLELAINLTEWQVGALSSKGIRELININTVTINQILEYTDDRLHYLITADSETLQRLRQGEITVHDVLNQNFNQRIQINNGQSTHTASVHKSVSDSANKLFDGYSYKLNGVGLKNEIEELSSWVQLLPNDSLKNQAAKRAITRITDVEYIFTDPGSCISIRQLLALIWIAINDNNEEKLENAKQSLVDALDWIQRGYNKSILGIDDGGLDRPICIAGTFNKLVEGMAGILPECELIFVTMETAGLKLPIVVKEEALKYLEIAKQGELESFPQLLERIKNEGVEVIWDKVQEKVKTRMFEEFGSLFPGGPDSEGFHSFIETGKDTDLGQLPSDQFSQSEEGDPEETRNTFTP